MRVNSLLLRFTSDEKQFTLIYISMFVYECILCPIKVSHAISGGGATRPFLKDEDVEELHGDPTAGSCPKVWIRVQKWEK